VNSTTSMASAPSAVDNFVKNEDKCFHCGLIIPRYLKVERVFQNQIRRFCCPACEAVCCAIYDAGLEQYYLRTKRNNSAPAPIPAGNLEHYDIEAVQAEYEVDLGRQRKIQLLIDGIHCAACVWLIERVLKQMPGIIEAKVNLTNKKLFLTWDNHKNKLSDILERISQVGYSAVPYRPEVADQIIAAGSRNLMLRMAFAGFAMMNLMWISIALYGGGNQSEFRQLFHWSGFVLATGTLLYSGYPFIRNSVLGLRHGYLSMDLPISIGALATYAYSVYITISPTTQGEVYYDTLVNFLFIILVGRHLEANSKRRALASTQRLVDLQARSATLKQAENSVLVPIQAVRINDLVIVKPGELVPVDGVVVDGTSHVNESLMSGETRLVPKIRDDCVSAGTLNSENILLVRVTAVLANTALGRIIHRVEEAQASKTAIECTADRIVPWFVLATLLLAGFTFLWWIQTDIELAIMAATSVLIITCPCAFGLATPMAISAAASTAADHNILIKNGSILEILSKADHVVFDKTGTLTESEMRVEKIVCCTGIDSQTLMRLVASLEIYSSHPLAQTIIHWVKSNGIEPLLSDQDNVPDLETQPGLGIRGSVSNIPIVVGSRIWLQNNEVIINEELLDASNSLENTGAVCLYVAISGKHVGVISLREKLRDDSFAVVEALRGLGISMSIVSGDRYPIVEYVSNQLGGLNFAAETLPDEKEKYIQHLRKQGHKVIMVGDGINDAAALKRADVGIALSSGTDMSAESADILLLKNQLTMVATAIRLSSRTLHTIRQNIAISISYNIVFVPLAMSAMITPVIAAISMPISSLLVIGNAWRIRRFFNTAERK